LLTAGKDKVKLLKVYRDPGDPKKQSVVEFTVQILLEGAIETSYTKADNSVVVATDTMKNTVYCRSSVQH
jgi:urate oxidase